MMRIQCPRCDRRLDVPIGHEAARSVCPVCGAEFVPAEQTTNASQAVTATFPPVTRAPKQSRKRSSFVKSESADANWRHVKRSYVVTCLLLFLVIFIARAAAWFQSDSMVDLVMIPLVSVPVTIIWILASGLMHFGPHSKSYPNMRWLIWPFLVGILLGIGVVVMWAIREGNITPLRGIAAAIVVAPIFGVTATIATMWAMAFLHFLGLVSRKIEKASQPDDVSPQAQRLNSKSKS